MRVVLPTPEVFGLEPGDTLAVATVDGWADVEVLGVAASPEYLWPAKSRQEILILPDEFGVVRDVYPYRSVFVSNSGSSCTVFISR